MARLAYSLLAVLLLPWALLHLLLRARRQRAYLQHWGERFGRYRQRSDGPLLWVHAVSVGETRAAQPLIEALRRRYPGQRILLTHMTPTGRAAGEALFGDGVDRAYLPYDTPWAVRRFLDHFRPRLGIVMETELWPNLIAACRTGGVPLLLVNARLSARSARRYGRFPKLARQALAGFAGIAARGDADAARLAALGATGVRVLGNLKFDIAPPPDQLALGGRFRQGFGQRPALLLASSREGEEELLLDALAPLLSPQALLVVVPRHPQRFAAVAALVAARGLRLQRRSDGRAVAAETRVWLGDSMGELFAYYAAADVAVIGGSLLDYGSQNLIEACAVGTPVLLGPSTYNFAAVAADAVAAGAALQCDTVAQLAAACRALLDDAGRRRAMAEAGGAFAARHRGATARTVELVAEVLGS